MSSHLWRYYLEDDVDRFRHLLETAAYNVRGNTQKGGFGGQGAGVGTGGGLVVGSPGGLGTSPIFSTKSRKSGHGGTPGSGSTAITLTRADLNWRDGNGLTILHHAASSASDNAVTFAQALVDHPLTDLYLQDLESGWTALHRAFYFGNITIARSILERDAENAFGRVTAGAASHSIGLIKIKDKEGLGPLDLYAATIKDRTLRPEGGKRSRSDSAGSELDSAAVDHNDDDDEGRRKASVDVANIVGDDCMTFGSNRNITLGFGDEDDRQFPERIVLRRPDHLLQRFYREHAELHGKTWSAFDPSMSLSHGLPVASIPWTVRSRPLVIQEVHMAKLHTAVLTTDPESNLYMCGHGPGGRLGTGDERTRFHFACIEGGALSGKKVAAASLGQNHTLALSAEGEIFSWGSNGFGQLGYALPKTSLMDEDPVQILPRQIFGPLKRELVVGIAASRIHSVAYTSSSLYTWGKNEGQLGLVDSDARSLEVQITPRKVAASLFATPIAAVSAIDRATICLLASTHEVWVFANYGYAKVQFPLDGFSNYFLKQSFLVTRYDSTINHISKITAAGDTICAMSSSGEVYSLSVGQPQSTQLANASTTNPTKIKSALTQPLRIWSLKKNNMAARDVGVDADGSIIISTEEGSVWKRSRRAKIKDATALGTAEYKPKDYKFSRVSGLTRVIGVRSSGYGAYAAVRRDCDVTRTQTAVQQHTLWTDMFALLCFSDLTLEGVESDSESEEPEPRFWTGRKKVSQLQSLKQQLLQSKDLEKDLKTLLRTAALDDSGDYDAFVGSTVSDLRLPVHQFVLAARSPVLRRGLHAFRHGHTFAVQDLLVCERDARDKPVIMFQTLDELTLVNIVLYLYADTVVDYWHYTRQSPKSAVRYRQIRTELMKVASKLELLRLEPAVRQMVEPTRTLNMDMEVAIRDLTFFEQGDISVQLADEDVLVHSALICQRCPFFEGLFMGRAGGRWLDERRGQLQEPSEAVMVDLKHVESRIFRMVLRHIYADTGEELFDDIVTADLDEFLDVVMDVMAVANELMLDRLSQVCQKMAGRYVNVRNVCSLLNAIAPSSVTEFKDASLEYMCLGLEAMLQGGLLDELDEDLLLDLDAVVRDNQLACMPFAKSGRAEAKLHEDHPELAALIDRNRRAKIDSVNLHSKYVDSDLMAPNSFRAHSMDEAFTSPSQLKARRKSSGHAGRSGAPSPALKGKAAVEELGTSVDEEAVFDLGRPALRHVDSAAQFQRDETLKGTPPPPAVWYDSKGRQLSPSMTATNAMTSTTAEKTLEQILAPSPRLEPQDMPSNSASVPWAATPSSDAKLGMKDIMAQASTSRVSNLSLGIAASRAISSPESPAVVPFSKLSQKERKKMQQQQQLVAVPEPMAFQPSSSPAAKGSPWQIASAQRVPSLKDVLITERQPSPGPLPKPSLSRTPTTPQLTMRQTIANAKPPAVGASPKSIIGPGTPSSPQLRPSHAPKPGSSPATHSPSIRPAAPPHQTRKASTTTTTTAASTLAPIAAPDLASQTSFPTIQSVRHQPRPVEASLQLSMSDILSQQQLEKDIIREAAAKRSLQDIQTEQEFQEWWDREAARMREGEDGEEEEDGVAVRGGGGARGPKKGVVRRRVVVDAAAAAAGKRGGGGGGGRRGARGGASQAQNAAVKGGAAGGGARCARGGGAGFAGPKPPITGPGERGGSSRGRGA